MADFKVCFTVTKNITTFKLTKKKGEETEIQVDYEGGSDSGKSYHLVFWDEFQDFYHPV